MEQASRSHRVVWVVQSIMRDWTILKGPEMRSPSRQKGTKWLLRGQKVLDGGIDIIAKI